MTSAEAWAAFLDELAYPATPEEGHPNLHEDLLEGWARAYADAKVREALPALEAVAAICAAEVIEADTLGLLEALAKKYGYAIVGERVPEDEDFLAHNTNIVEVFTFTPEGGEGLYYCDGNGEEQPRAEAAALLRDEPPTAGRSEGEEG